ncbi:MULTISPECIES: hypothetical protein [Chryseobacterium group]|nr:MULTISPECIES: hypothetical protein [Chryseobacterium group]MDF0718997.1 hypothetical protein [Kaistella sp. PBT33-4]
MKKNDTLNAKLLKPRKSTVSLLLNFSKSITVLKTRTKVVAVSQN